MASSHPSPWTDLPSASFKKGAKPHPRIPGALSNSATTFHTIHRIFFFLFFSFLCINTHNERQMGSLGSFFHLYFFSFPSVPIDNNSTKRRYRAISQNFRRRTSAGRSGRRFFFHFTVFSSQRGTRPSTAILNRRQNWGLGRRDLEPEGQIHLTNRRPGERKKKKRAVQEFSKDRRGLTWEKEMGKSWLFLIFLLKSLSPFSGLLILFPGLRSTFSCFLFEVDHTCLLFSFLSFTIARYQYFLFFSFLHVFELSTLLCLFLRW